MEKLTIDAEVELEAVSGGQCVTVRNRAGELLAGFIATKGQAGAMTAQAAVGRALRGALKERLQNQPAARRAEPGEALEALAKFEEDVLGRLKAGMRVKNASEATRQAAAAIVEALADARRTLLDAAPGLRVKAEAKAAGAAKPVQGELF